MRLKIVHIWIVNSILGVLTDLWLGLVITLATLIILAQDHQLEELRNSKHSSPGGKE